MPLLTETTHPRKRCALVWLLILALVVLLVVGFVGWSCYRPVAFEMAGHGVGCGYGDAGTPDYLSASWRAPQHPSGLHLIDVWQWVPPRGWGLSYYRVWWY